MGVYVVGIPHMPEIDDAIRENAEGPAQVQGDEAMVRQHSLRDQIEADKYLSAKAARRKRGLGIQFRQIVPPGGEM